MPPLVQRSFAGAKSPATSLVVISPVPTRSKSYGAKTSSPPPTGYAGTEYVKEHTRLLRAYKDKTPLERIALQAIMVMPGLLLQKPHTKAGSKEFNKHLSRRLTLWKAGKIRELLDEARTIQSRLPDQDSRNGLTSHKLNRRFAALVSKGNIHAAISLITEHNKGGVLELTPEVRSALQAKHPKAQPAHAPRSAATRRAAYDQPYPV